ncbi:hypothetical protein MSIMFB_00965 [Mycobacterium simulans]|uniref:PE domain-containing protein n=1 Tax=Mycobacterium simulans TaxID=627089 RepID=A0A7Z7IH60_9MYCO|nr:PE domain-containing protein [Mycobacterium simulans]SOJ53462.1 hypothetical protein MSIMFB_00965 [Mycobacterium simulans]SON58823.1 hypothetical protein MSIMFI_00301 [Mycobacterium simulans]
MSPESIQPTALTAPAHTWQEIRSALAVVPAAADEVSVLAAARFTAHALELSAQTAAMHQVLVDLTASFG